MKKIYLLLILFIANSISAQTEGTPVQGVVPIKRILPTETTAKTSTTKTTTTATSTAKLAVAPTVTGTSQEVGITEGQLSVSLTGGASYGIPIAVPPGINGVVPQIALTYTSQGGNGMAGYGWNVSGVSAITRIPRTKFHDTVVGGVNLDANDRFALDGQRLILKTGTPYGAAGTIYETENFSNLKITAVGVSLLGAAYGPASFKVAYPDGSTAYYGTTTDSNSITTWGIAYWENPQGVRISYTYNNANNTITIASIKYGSVGTATTINEVKFNYITRLRPEQTYIGGQSIVTNTILNKIETIGNGVGFRSYALLQEPTSLNYQRLIKITETSGDGTKSYNPTVFSYDTTTNDNLFGVNPNKPQLTLSNITGINAGTEVADFDGDGKNDFIIYPKTGTDSYKKYWIYNNIYGGSINIGWEHAVGDFTSIFATSFLVGDSNNGYKLMPQQGWTVVKNNNDQNYSFSIYSIGTFGVGLQYTKTVAFPSVAIDNGCTGSTITKIFPKKILSGDFNGDGLTDAIAIDNSLSADVCDSDYNTTTITVNSQSVYFIDLKKDVNNLSTPIGNINEIATNDTNIQVIDFNSDGKSDFMVLTEGKVTVYTLGTTNNLIVLATYTDAGLQANKPCLLGDFNGDGKTDFVIPQADEQDSWCFYNVTGKGFVKIEKAIGIIYHTNKSIETEINGDWHHRSVNIQEYNYIANDFNGDGKTDILNQYNYSFDHINNYTTSYGRRVFDGSDFTGKGSSIFTVFTLGENKYTTATDIVFSYTQKSISGLIHSYPIPLFTNHTKPNLNLEYSLLTDNTIYTFNCNKDNRIDSRLTAITTGNGVTKSITYKPLDIVSTFPLNNYSPTPYKSIYPNTDIVVSPSFQVVSMLEQQSVSVYKKQLFAYAGATSNVEGLGFLGFRATMHTNWFETDNQIISSVTKFDPNMRAAAIENYTYQGLITPEFVANRTAPTTGIPNRIVKTNYTQTGSETLTASGVILLQPGTTGTSIKPTTGNAFTATILPNYDSTGFAETGTTPDSSLITKSLWGYEASLSPTKVYKLLNVQSKNYNLLDSTSSETNTLYDTYSNPTEAITKLKNAGIDEQVTTTTVKYATPYTAGRPASKIQNVTASGNSMTSKEIYTYGTGVESNLLKQIDKYGNTTTAITEKNDYDAFGNIVVKKILATGITERKTSYAYDTTGRFLTESTDVEGFKNTFEYNPNGTLKSKTNQTELGTTNNSLTTSYDYDVWFKKIQTTNYLGKTTNYAYKREVEKTKITTTGGDDGSWSEELFDELGRKIKTSVKDIQGNTSYKDYKYDIYDRNFSISEPNSTTQSNTTEYDVYGRPKTITYFTGKIVSMVYDKLKTTVTDSSTGKSKASTKNAMGNVVALEENVPGVATNGIINYTYFANGNLKETNYDTTKITITQDGWGRKTSLKDSSAGTYTYEYNALGESTKETTPNGTTTYTLDPATSKITSKTIVGKAPVTTNTKTVYTYNDTTDKLLQKTVFTDTEDGSKTIMTLYTYDDKKRLSTTKETTGYGAVFDKTIGYDAWGRPNVETSTATLNGKSSTSTITTTYVNGYAQKTTNAAGTVLWETTEVNARGQLTKATLGNGIAINNTYDQYGYVTNMKHTLTATATTVMELTNDFDAQRGNLKSRTNGMFNTNDSFGYDFQDRLISYPNALGVVEKQTYMDDGRIDTNTLGTYKYNNAQMKYQNTSVTLTPEATGYYVNREGVFNDSMEERANWNKQPYNPTAISFDDTNAHSGKNSLKINTTGTGQAVAYVQSNKLIKIDNTTDTQYTFSGWVKTDSPTAQLTLFEFKENETAYFTKVESVATATVGQWKFITKTVTVPATIKYLNIRADNVGTGTVWFDDVIIRKTSNAALVNLPIPDATYKDRKLAITYNTFKSPVSISEAGVDKMSFTYNDNNDRSVMFYGSLDVDKNLRPNRKYYSADGTMEIKENTKTGAIEFITYLGGDGYSAPVVYKKTYPSTGTPQEQILYLHRDYQGSILAITNDVGLVLEKRLFDAWGNIAKVQDGAGNTLSGLTLLDRGYTGHEHLQSVGLIDMNARLYDPKLHRFLQPDNYVQDPSNTQNYNRYGYVLNNPLAYTDESGEEYGDGDCHCIHEGNQPPTYTPEQQNGLAQFIKGVFESDWVSRNFSARNFDEAGTAIGKGFRDATNFVVGGISRLFGGRSASAPEFHVGNVGQAFSNFGQQATVFGGSYAGVIATNNITFGMVQMPNTFTGTNFEGAERLGRYLGDITSMVQGAIEDIGAGVGEVLSLGVATVPAGAVAIHGSSLVAGSAYAGLAEAKGLFDYFARDRSGGGKGTTFRGGSKESRDGYLTKQPKDFQRWYHTFYKKNSGGPNISDSEIDELLEEWNRMGRPKS
ncbi:RHS repeat-associated core domain-containing protein [Flavobacterium restrictum]|uniref:Insecticide toxin TcdB middle/N-terminal domain-containing protein n=1 Tax=Flavobacterium restrictum TaxID=2594428 RepID=A0A553DT93_9FLAO|nr:RHS repeat-associated core domain-containing protein [Flavobacterium restrictum]TRX35949.1 hypothetical protein FNW21_14100 [Flavobacterium restrictum]